MAPAKPATTMRAGWLAARFKALREDRGLKGAEVADYIGKTQGTVSKLENGEFPLTGDTILRLMDLYGVSDLKERNELLQLSEEVAQRGWWDGYASLLGSNFADYIWMESRADAMHILEINAVPGLLQVPEYASALIGRGPQSSDEFQVRRLTEARLLRREQLSKPHSPHVRFLVHEGALHQEVGKPGVMKEQLEYLLTAMQRSNLEIRVIPLRAWSHTAATVGGGFTMFELPVPFPNVVAVESPAGAIYVEGPDIDSFTSSYNAIWADALSASKTEALIAQLAKDAAT
ncbi:helix-turn-helix domain-containing protein [Phytomonospora endophytica]|uniref:Transcriptional regulator with XRE-family HTH domain n=1 Tax=Phytomonospora endophytica TaxID=714109 RepID=A0A841FVF1_9ACTN|nr:helix-turn-helix transcriptional regulator [Phytomonospora endophytica]MBB6037708.1 transcriptional regulator with XRE-family HTH domain [Phytomonospora endophytica]